jgi:S1-C subfamily serine protease
VLFRLHQAEDLAKDEEPDVGIQTLRGRIRPVEGGYSVGHYRITAGTMATAVYDRSPFPGIPRRYYMLSNNHVLANSNSARIGDPILQPGPYDGGTYPRDLVARLYRFVPIRFDGSCNYVDAAIAVGEFHDLDREIYWIGYVKGVATVGVNTIVQKTGRTTSYTSGRVTAINATVNVNYGSGRVGRMCRQIVTTNMSAGGDSGSLLCDMNERAVGLLFAGSSSITIHNDIRYVQALLGIRVV